MDDLDIVEYLRKNAVFNYRDTYIAAANEIERLRKERDEARRIACEKQAKINQRLYDDKFYANPVVVMRDWGWDCYGSND